MTLRLVAPVALSALLGLSGCATFYPVETTPEGITRNIEPGDTVRVITRDQGEMKLLVTAIDDYRIRGRVNGRADDVLSLRFDTIQALEIERLNMRKALLTVVLPVVVGAIVVCNEQEDCRTDGAIDARY